MTATLIVLLIIGIILVLLSFFIVDKEDQKKGKTNSEYLSTNELFEEEFKKMRTKIQKILDEEMVRCINDTEDNLNKISNEKIMSVHELSEQLLAKIENNNEEVVFLYNMLKNKEDEFKATWNKIEAAKRENTEWLDKIAEIDKSGVKTQASKLKEKTSRTKTKEKTKQPENILTSLDASYIINPDKNSADIDSSDVELSSNTKELSLDEQLKGKKTKEILRLYKQNKSITEISKQLELGQGEVKLIIDIYANKK